MVLSLFVLKLEDDREEEKKPKKLPMAIQKGQSKLFAKLPAPRNSDYVPPIEQVSKTVSIPEQPVASIKKSVSLIPQSVMRREAKKGSDDEDETSGNFFTLDEPALPAISVPVNIQASAWQKTNVAIQKEQVIVFPAIPTNQLYNMAGMVNSDTPQPTYAGQMELDDAAVSLPLLFAI